MEPKPVNNIILSERIKQRREEEGMTQEELSEATGIPLSTLKKYEQGTRNPKFEALYRLDRVLDMGMTVKLPLESHARQEAEQTTELPQIKKLLLKENFSLLPQEEIDDLSNEVDKDLDEYCNSTLCADATRQMIENEKEITHKIFDDIMAPYANQSVFDIVKVLAVYLSLNCDGEKLVLDFLKACSNTPGLVKKDYDPSDRRPIECRRPEAIRRQYLQ